MAQIDKDAAIDLATRMKADVLAVLNKYANEASQIAVNMTDPHAPVIAFTQMALANAAADYLKLCGATPTECFQVTCNVTGNAMQQWVQAVLKKHGATAQVIDVQAQKAD